MQYIVPLAAETAARRFDHFRAAVSDTFCPMRCDTASAYRADFQASLEVNRLHELSLSVIGSSPIDVYRSKADIGQASDAFYLVKFQLEGEAMIRHRGHEAHLSAGDFVMCTTTEPYSLHFHDDYKEAVLAVSHARLNDLIRFPEDYLGRRMAATEPANGLLSSFIAALSARMHDVDAALAQRLEANILDLLVTALQHQRAPREAPPQLGTQHLYRVRNYIHLHLADPELCPERIARAEGISTRYLHVLFKQAGGSVSRYIQQQRLEASRQSLARADMNAMSVTEIAFRWGFNDSSHFNRLFKASFGITPLRYRVQSQVG